MVRLPEAHQRARKPVFVALEGSRSRAPGSFPPASRRVLDVGEFVAVSVPAVSVPGAGASSSE
jgi:hypothetical protein